MTSDLHACPPARLVRVEKFLRSTYLELIEVEFPPKFLEIFRNIVLEIQNMLINIYQKSKKPCST